MNIQNFNEIIEYIKNVNPMLFSMRYIEDNTNLKRCILGCVRVAIPYRKQIKFVTNRGKVNVEKLGEWYFGIQEGSNEWDYLFNSNWANDRQTDSPEHAIYRLSKIVDGYEPDHIDTEITMELIKLSGYEN